MAKALHLAKVTGDGQDGRLSRNAAFILALQDSGVQFVAYDMPEANDITVGMMKLMTQAEQGALLWRTKWCHANLRAFGDL